MTRPWAGHVQRPTAWLLALAMSACGSATVHPGAAGGEPDLMRWVSQDLTPYLREQLSSHPRFKGEPVLLVAMHGPDVLPDIDGLSGSIRSRLMDSLLDTPGVNLVWRPSTPLWEHHRRPTRTRCQDPSAVHYYLGIQVLAQPGGDARVSVRALDLQDQAWVSGFGRHWQGRLSAAQQGALSSRQADEYLRGLRVLPFDPGQTDLAAAYLAENLGCLLGGGTSAMRVYVAPVQDAPAGLQTTLGLLGNYLGRLQAVPLTDDPAAATHVLRAEAHAVHGGTYQVWARLHPRPGASESTTIDTLAYVRLGTPAPGGLAARQADPDGGDRLLSPLRLLAPRDPGLCASADPWHRGERRIAGSEPVPAGGCFAVELAARRDADVFLLDHRPDTALVRLLPDTCEYPGRRVRLAAGETLRVPARGGGVAPRRGSSGMETFYVLATSDPAASQALAHHLQGLPDACEPAERGPHEEALDRWLRDLDRLMARHGTGVDWQAVRVRHGP